MFTGADPGFREEGGGGGPPTFSSCSSYLTNLFFPRKSMVVFHFSLGGSNELPEPPLDPPQVYGN